MERFLDYFTPETYNLNLTIDRHAETVKGSVTLTGTPHNETIKLHAVAMKSLTVADYPYRYENDTLEIDLPSEQTAKTSTATDPKTPEKTSDHPTQITITFETILSHNMQSCYLSTYRHENREERIAVTQFESHYARECFPCIDEPAAKAVFNLSITVPDLEPGDIVLANTELAEQQGNTFTFTSTPRMSTYLLAWVIGKFHKLATVNKNGVKVTSYCALNQSPASLTFPNDTAARALEYYDKKFGQKYPLTKLDQVAIPDFEAGAMENWGLVTYRESMMLADDAAALDTKQSVAVTITHELSHQWFGNLVTMAWWDDLWLNESFASIMEYYCADALYPDFHCWEDFFTSDCVAALRRDALPGVQAVQQPVHHPAEIATLFDGAIVYAKGARLILMLIRLMGEEQFDAGIRDYFQKHAYHNTVGDDLWDALQPYADFNVKEFMHAWISQPGYPVISGTALASISASTSSSTSETSSTPVAPSAMSPSGTALPHPSSSPSTAGTTPVAPSDQHRFLLAGATDDTKWPIPHVFDDMSGHYLLNLSSDTFHAKLTQDLTPEQRIRLLLDRSLLAKTPAVASVSLLDLLPKFVPETSASVFSIVSDIIGDLKLFCPAGSTAEKNYKTYLNTLFAPCFAKIDLNASNLNSNALRLRDAHLGIALYVRNAAIAEKLTTLYNDDFSKMDPELLAAILVATLRSDETKYFPLFLEKYKTVTSPEQKAPLLSALVAHSQQPAHLDTLLSLLEQPEVVRPQDHIMLYIYLLRNPHTRTRTLNWLTSHWSYVENLTGEKSIEDYPRYAAVLIRTPSEASVFYNFFNPLSDQPILKRTLEIARAEIDARLQLIADDAPAIEEKLATLIQE